jgi:glucokinase
MVENASGPPVLGIDLGGTKILAGVVGPRNEVLGRAKRPTPATEGGEAILKAMVEAVDEALAEARLARGDIAGVTVGSPGPLDPETGVILFSSNIQVKDFPLGPLLSGVLNKPVLLQNDVRVGGYGEFHLGAAAGSQNMLAAFVGTGIGGCLVRNGEIIEGATGNAGEIGHIILKPGGPKCGCGRRGCMEALASRTAIARRINKAIQKGQSTSLRDKVGRKSGRLKSGELAEAVLQGDAVAAKEVGRAAYFLGLGLGSLMNVFGPEVVVIGGGVTEALGEAWVERVRTTAREICLVDPTNKIRILPAALGDDAGMLGAALMARERFVHAEPVAV